MSPVTHIVAFKFKPKTSAEDKAGLYKAMMRLKDACKKEDGKPYILSVKGGREQSKEKFNRGLQVVFVAEFASEEDLDYYVSHDKAHHAFVHRWALEGVVEEGLVLDFKEGWEDEDE
ncbi:hypothetical protein QFC24_003729 [Naganishia onofrii]|uniref:Uncharacterized protein n=1 Tax=Naganishia onofrii TaxID=1851511 RepID=A0ACC2XIU1_9TREE|nr:hypothetical protein QFC24_003729 [Naganishia onofrii]